MFQILEQQLSKLKEELKEFEENKKLDLRPDHTAGLSLSSLTHKDPDQPSEREKLLQDQLDKLKANFETMLASQVQGAEEQRTRAEEEVQEKTRQLEELRQRLKDSEASEFNSLNDLVDLRNELDRIRDELEALRHVKDGLEEQVREYLEEIRKLRERLEDDRGFRRYVGVLRQLNEVKDANDTLRWKLEEKPSVTLMTLNPGAQRRRSRPVAASAGTPGRGKTERKSHSTAPSARHRCDQGPLMKTT